MSFESIPVASLKSLHYVPLAVFFRFVKALWKYKVPEIWAPFFILKHYVSGFRTFGIEILN